VNHKRTKRAGMHEFSNLVGLHAANHVASHIAGKRNAATFRVGGFGRDRHVEAVTAF
jgi:hypothetical protein